MFKNAILALVCLCAGEGMAASGTSVSTTRNGVNFTFSFNCDGGPCTHGRFVKGEPWVIPNSPTGTVTITAISPSGASNSAVVNPYIEYRNGTMVSGSKQGLLSMYDSYDGSLNIMNSLPYRAKADQSILKVKIQTSGCGTKAIGPGCVSTGSILTILANAPENDGATVFRPPFHGDWKPLYTTDKVMMERLPSLAYNTGTPSNFDHWLAPQYELLHKNFGELHRATIPHAAQTPYAADQAKKMLENMLALFGSSSVEQKRAGTYTIIQKGIDNYGVFKAGIPFSSGAGQHLGKKPPLAFFAAMYDDPAILEDVRAIALDDHYQNIGYFQEDSQIRSMDGRMPVWGERTPEHAIHWYFSRLYPRLDKNGGYGDPYGYIDGPAGLVYPDDSETMDRNYLPVSGGAHIGYAFLQHMMPWLEYAAGDWEILKWADRIYDGYGIDNFNGGIWTKPDACAAIDRADNSGCAPYKLYSTGDTGCSRYQVTWGPVKNNLTECIRHNGNDMTDGRAPSLHGTKMEFNRLPTFVKAAWKLLRPCADPANAAYPCEGLGPEPSAAVTDLLRLYDTPDVSPISVSPNPSSGYVRIAGPENEYLVYDSGGRLVKTVESFAYLDAGIYMVTNAGRTAVQRVVVLD